MRRKKKKKDMRVKRNRERQRTRWWGFNNPNPTWFQRELWRAIFGSIAIGIVFLWVWLTDG